MPDLAQLAATAAFRVGDRCFTPSSGPWKVVARYWRARQQCIVYDLVFEYNGVELPRVPERDLSVTDTRGGFVQGR